MKPVSKNTRRSSCGAPIPSFKSELDQLERELQEDDEEDRRRRQRRDRRQQSKQLESKQSANGTSHDVEPVSLVLVSVGEANDDDDELLSFAVSFRGNDSLTTRTSEGQVHVDSEHKENNDDEMDHCVWDPFDDEGCATAVPLADSTNCERGDSDPAVQSERSPAKPLSPVEVLEVKCQPPTSLVKCQPPTSLTTAVEATKEASDVTFTLSQAVVEIFERSDVETCTCKQVWKQLEDKHGFQLDKNSRKLVRSQLTALIQQYLEARARAELTFASDGSEHEVTVKEAKIAADMTEQSCGKRKTPDEPKVVSDGSSSLRSLQVHVAQEPSSEQSRDANAENGSAWSTLQEESSAKPHTKSEPKNVAATGKLLAPQPKRRGRPPKASKVSGNPKGAQESDSRGVKRVFQGAAHQETTVVPTPPRKTKRNKPQCALCNACPCRHPPASTASSVMSLARSDAAVEKALVRRLLKLEQATDRYEEQTEAVRRKLKKHRRDMWRKMNPMNETSQNRSEHRFLPDAADMDRASAAHSGSNLLDESTVQSAKSSLFSFASTYQPTLTQMFGCQLTEGTESLDRLESVELDKQSEENGQSQTGEVASDEMPVIGEEEDSFAFTDGNDDALDVERVEIRNGVDVTEETTRIWGAYSSAGGYKSLWDRIFDDPKEAEALTLEQLETMFDEFLPPASAATNSTRVALSMLTQRGQLLAHEIMGRVNLSPDRVARLSSSCPEWEENVLFAFRQGCAGDVRSALAGVLETQSKLLRSKEALLKAIEAQEEVLTVFSEALTASLTRFDSESPISSPAPSCSITDHCKRASVDRDDEDASEVKTLSVSSSSPSSSQEEPYG